MWTEENFWKWNGKDAHNISFYYLIDLYEGTIIPDGFTPLKDNCNVVFGWVSIEELKDINIYPQFLKKEVHRLGECPKHFISRE